jgi:tRNA dimethylallyltransferase
MAPTRGSGCAESPEPTRAAMRLTILPAMSRAAVIALFGPTAVGKTAVAVALAELLRAEGQHPVAVSADALQVYAGLETLTGAPSEEERAVLEHRLVGFLPVSRRFSAGEYAALAHVEIDSLLAAGARPLVLGGTGLYLRAALADLDLRPPPDPAERERWQRELERRGPQALHAELRARSRALGTRIDPGDRQRIVRALELLEAGEEPAIGRGEEPGGSQLWTEETRHPTLLVGLVLDRDALAERIDCRVDAMVAAGAAAEVRRAAQAGVSETARKALGFEELERGDAEALKRRTRQYARRQLTWMRKLPGTQVLDVTGREPAEVAQRILRLWRGD